MNHYSEIHAVRFYGVRTESHLRPRASPRGIPALFFSRDRTKLPFATSSWDLLLGVVVVRLLQISQVKAFRVSFRVESSNGSSAAIKFENGQAEATSSRNSKPLFGYTSHPVSAQSSESPGDLANLESAASPKG
jgi:hypothetical protein